MLPEAIPASVATLLSDIHTWPLPVDTYMAGGTAVATYLNHRVSVDIDLFTDKEFYCGPIISSIGQRYATTVTNPAEKNTLIAIVANVRFRKNTAFRKITAIRKRGVWYLFSV